MVNMCFRKFAEFLKERDVSESSLIHDEKIKKTHGPRPKLGFQKHLHDPVNRHALEYEKNLAAFNGRFDNPREAEAIVKAAGYGSVAEFVNDPDEGKWCRLKIPGQENYVK
jgi:hypothetical protein